MGRTTGNLAAITPSSSPKKSHRVDPPHETLRRVGEAGNSAAPEDFDAFADAVRRELAPDGLMEAIVADRVALVAWRLVAASRAEAEAARKAARPRRRSRRTAAVSVSVADAPAPIDLSLDLDREQIRLEQALDLLQKLRDRRPAPPATVVETDPAIDACDDFDPADLSNEWAVIPDAFPADAPAYAPEPDDEPHEPWQDRLVFDFNVSETSPIVKGTWVTVGHVVSLIVDGWTWGDILRTHPELTEDDIRICLAYTVAQDDGDVDA
jgi:uncharacterized protein (DUF433 family)